MINPISFVVKRMAELVEDEDKVAALILINAMTKEKL
jgi:hypothetical protein